MYADHIFNDFRLLLINWKRLTLEAKTHNWFENWYTKEITLLGYIQMYTGVYIQI